MGWPRRDRGIPAGPAQTAVGSSVSSGGKDQEPLKQVQVRGGGSSGEGPTVTTMLTARTTTAVTSEPPQNRASSHFTLEADAVFILSLDRQTEALQQEVTC